MRWRFVNSGVAVLVLATLAAGCGQGDESGGDSGKIPEVKVGYVNGLTGETAGFGVPFREAAELALAKVNESAEKNGFRLKFDVRDDQGDPKQCATIAQDQIGDDSTVAAIGWSSSSCLQAAVPIYDQGKMPMLASGTTAESLAGSSPYFHRNTVTDAIQGAKTAEYVTGPMGAKRIAIFTANDSYAKPLADAFESRAKELGGEIVLRQEYPLGTKDFTAAVTKLKDADVDVVYVSGYYTEGSKVVQQAKEIGVDAKFVGGEGMLTKDFISLSGGAAEGTIMPTQYIAEGGPKVDEFIQDFKAKYGREPGLFEAIGYDSVFLLANALKSKGEFTREGINAALADACVDGVLGRVCLGKGGEVVRDLFFVQVKGDEFVPVEKPSK